MTKRKKREPKAFTQRKHFKKRLLERYGVTINRIEIMELVQQIQTGQAKHIVSQSNRISIFDVRFLALKVRVVYDRTRKTLVTALEPDWTGELNLTDEPDEID